MANYLVTGTAGFIASRVASILLESGHSVVGVDNIDDANLVVALIDDRDIGTIFEIGYAFAMGVPVITFTNMDYGMNLMLAESVLAHCKGVEQLTEALDMIDNGATDEMFTERFKRANLSEGKEADKKMDLYKKGE